MQASDVSEFLSMLKDSLLRVVERNHLHSMKTRFAHRDTQDHADIIDKVGESPEINSHQRQIEHNARNFWRYYFEGENPDIDQPLPEYINEGFDDKIRLKTFTFELPLTKLIPALDGVGGSEKDIARRWVRAFTLAQLSLSEKQYKDAEGNFRIALTESDRFDNKRSRKKALAAKGLAESLEKQGREEEAQGYYELALSIDEELVGNGEISLETEFYGLTKHLLDAGKYEKLEKLFDDLAQRLRLSVGRNDPMMARCLNELGIVYFQEQKFKEAETSFARSIEILERLSPSPNRQLAALHNNYALLLEHCDRSDEAEEHYHRAVSYLGSVSTPISST